MRLFYTIEQLTFCAKKTIVITAQVMVIPVCDERMIV